jgi:hypothetical protein
LAPPAVLVRTRAETGGNGKEKQDERGEGKEQRFAFWMTVATGESKETSVKERR